MAWRSTWGGVIRSGAGVGFGIWSSHIEIWKTAVTRYGVGLPIRWSGRVVWGLQGVPAGRPACSSRSCSRADIMALQQAAT